MKKTASLMLILVASIFIGIRPASAQKELPKIAVWDLVPRNTPTAHAQELTSILVSEISKLEKYEVYSQENVRTLAGWTAERMTLGCTDTKCLTALGQMDIAKLISGSVGRIGNTFSISLNLFDTQNARAEKSVSDFCRTEDELIPLIQQAVRKLLGVEGVPSRVEEKIPEKVTAAGALPTLGESFKDLYTGMEFTFVKGGCYEMGDTFGDGNEDEKPSHEVCVDDFYIGIYEVTQGQWEKVMGNKPWFFVGDNYPVEMVSWLDALQFIERLNNQTGRKFRLPTEAEWEYAARSGGKEEKWAGTSREEELVEYAWHNKNSNRRSHPVGQKKPNGLGLYDMTGNVWEWCADWYQREYYNNSPRKNPNGPKIGGLRVLRGGAWNGNPGDVRVSLRTRDVPSASSFYHYGGYGFRLGLSAR